MKIAQQGEIEVLPRDTAVILKVNAFENNKTERADKPFSGEIVVQPHLVLPFWRILSENGDFLRIKSGKFFASVKNKADKGGVRIFFRKDKEGEVISEEPVYEMESVFFLRSGSLARFRQMFLRAVKEIKVLTLKDGSFFVVKTPNVVTVKNDQKEVFLNEGAIKGLRDMIFQNYFLSEPRPSKGKFFTIEEDGNLVFRGVRIPKEIIKDFYVLVLS